MGSYLKRPGSLGELRANAPTTDWSTGFFLFETPGRRPGWSLWSPPMLFLLLRVCDARSASKWQLLQAWGASFFTRLARKVQVEIFDSLQGLFQRLKRTTAPLHALLLFLQPALVAVYASSHPAKNALLRPERLPSAGFALLDSLSTDKEL